VNPYQGFGRIDAEVCVRFVCSLFFVEFVFMGVNFEHRLMSTFSGSKVKTIHSAQKTTPRPVAPLRLRWAARGTGEIHRSTADWPVTKQKICTALPRGHLKVNSAAACIKPPYASFAPNL
jgi:hypothetical protein